MLIWPVHMQLHVESDVNKLLSPIAMACDPGDHGDVTTGRHGCGVSTPCAAAVAAATCGFTCVLHIPNGAMFTMGMKSITVAIGAVPLLVWLVGSTVSELGDSPSLHWRFAPFATTFDMCPPGRCAAPYHAHRSSARPRPSKP